VAVLGSDDSGPATAAAADQLKVPDLGVLDAAATTSLPCVWSSGPDSSAIGAIDAAYALKNCTDLALLHDTSSDGDGGQAVVKLAYTNAHKTLALDDAVSENFSTGATASLTAQIKKIKASGASCVLAWLTPENTASLAQTLKASHVKVTLIANDAVVANQTFTLLAGSAANGTIAPELTTQLHPGAALASFTKSYQAKFHLVPSADAIANYDAVLMLGAAIEREHSTSPAKLQAALNSLTNSPELQGAVTFTKRDHATVTAAQLILVRYDSAAKAWKALS
jgi:ABC-type branched-subunit amino acid transport system substrate-binding protein